MGKGQELGSGIGVLDCVGLVWSEVTCRLISTTLSTLDASSYIFPTSSIIRSACKLSPSCECNGKLANLSCCVRSTQHTLREQADYCPVWPALQF